MIFTDYFRPGFKAGGPIRALENLIEKYKNERQIFLVTRGFDKGDNHYYPNVALNKWQKKEGYFVSYLKRKNSIQDYLKILHDRSWDVIYFNSFFSFSYSIFPLLLIKIFKINTKIVLAPRGELCRGALIHKRHKKILFIFLSSKIKLHQNIHWHLTSKEEKRATLKIMGPKIQVTLLPDLLWNIDQKQSLITNDPIRILYLSRICPQKNLLFALQLLTKIEKKMTFNIYGPIEDNHYWEKCQNVISTLDFHNVQYHGIARPHDVANIFSNSQLFLFPTMSENFGYVIFESLASGCPVLTTDQIPWDDIEEAQAGWRIPLDQPQKFIKVIESILKLSPYELHLNSQKAMGYYEGKKNFWNQRVNYTQGLL